MMCPRCGHEWVCGCDNCRKRTNGKIRWKWITDEIEACGRCGLAATADQWLDEEYAQLAAGGRDKWAHIDATRKELYLIRPGRLHVQPYRLPQGI